MADTPSLLALPPEIREEIYRIILHPEANRIESEDEYNDYSFRSALVLFRVNRQLYHESRRIFRDLNVFVRIATPWPEAENHVALAGHVPVLLRGDAAEKFEEHRLAVSIESPHMDTSHYQPQFFVILLDDLPKFTDVWLYSDLSNPGLNAHLSLRLVLRDPYTPAWDTPHISKTLQRRMLLPFGSVKDLGQLSITGEGSGGGGVKPLASIETELRTAQQVPHRSPEACLTDAVRLKTEGNELLKKGDYHGAIASYNAAWLAIHIVVKGRQRHVHAEAFFRRRMEADPWKDKDGQYERLMLRIQLVANTCQAYLKLADWEELRYWGLRTIHMMRQSALGPIEDDWDVPAEQEAVPGFTASAQMGKIYYRTAVACRELGDKGQARKLLRVAAIYLPLDESVKKEQAACALRLG